MIEALSIDQAVRLAIFEDMQWQETSGCKKTGPRVLLREGGVERAQRRPIRHGEDWFVRYCGRARLTRPERNINGVLTFAPDWSRELGR